MVKQITVRLDDGVFMVVEANAKKSHQTVADWIRAAVDEQIKRTVNTRILDRLDERMYRVDKGMTEVMAMLTRLQEAVDEIVPLEE
ncbi:MAG: hypothetical protein M0Z43_07245 [Acidithiobacillus sp.]|nr:hypothetical protein [Acidithiobacillus sp.]